jgi:hypothetical protein
MISRCMRSVPCRRRHARSWHCCIGCDCLALCHSIHESWQSALEESQPHVGKTPCELPSCCLVRLQTTTSVPSSPRYDEMPFNVRHLHQYRCSSSASSGPVTPAIGDFRRSSSRARSRRQENHSPCDGHQRMEPYICMESLLAVVVDRSPKFVLIQASSGGKAVQLPGRGPKGLGRLHGTALAP